MTRKTHIIMGTLASIPILIASPMSIIGLIGTVIPDYDLKISQKIHRTWTHSLLFLGLSTMGVYTLNSDIGMVWFISYLSHLVLDSLTKGGIPLFYPIFKKKYGLKICLTGGFIDNVLSFAGWVGLVVVTGGLIVDFIKSIMVLGGF